MLRSSLIILLCFGLSGCYNWYSVKPTEIPKISGTVTENLGQVGDVTIVGRTERSLERDDGRIVQISGASSARLTIDGQVLDFDHPVDARVEGMSLSIASANRARVNLGLDQIQLAEVSEYSPGKTLALIYLITFSVMGLALGITLPLIL